MADRAAAPARTSSSWRPRGGSRAPAWPGCGARKRGRRKGGGGARRAPGRAGLEGQGAARHGGEGAEAQGGARRVAARYSLGMPRIWLVCSSTGCCAAGNAMCWGPKGAAKRPRVEEEVTTQVYLESMPEARSPAPRNRENLRISMDFVGFLRIMKPISDGNASKRAPECQDWTCESALDYFSRFGNIVERGAQRGWHISEPNT